MSHNFKTFASFFGFLAVALFFGLLMRGTLAAWTAPAEAPPGGNVAAPINVGAGNQIKINGSIGSTSELRAPQFTDTTNGYVVNLDGISQFTNLLIDGGVTLSNFADCNLDTVGGVLTCGSAPPGLWTQSGSNIYYNTGNVGIGTTSPNVKLVVDGSLSLGDTGIPGKHLVAGDYGTASVAGGSFNNGDVFWFLSRQGAAYFKDGVRTDGEIFVDIGDILVEDGNIGIGTATPVAQVNIESGPTTTTPFRINTEPGRWGVDTSFEITNNYWGGNAGVWLTAEGTGSGDRSEIKLDPWDDLQIRQYDFDGTTWGGIGIYSNAVTLITENQVGLGLYSGQVAVGLPFGLPTETLDVNGNIRVRDLDCSGLGNGGKLTTLSDGTLACAADSGGDTGWTGAGTGVMYVTALNDLIGIGTTSPDTKLQISDSVNGEFEALRLTNTAFWNNEKINLSFYGYNDRVAAVIKAQYNHSNSDGDLEFWTADNNILAERMVIASTGNVGIGTASPAAKLDLTVNKAKTSTSSDTYALLGKTNEASGYGALKMNVKGAATIADRTWSLQTMEQGVGNDGVLALQPDGGKVGIGTSIARVPLHFRVGTSGSASYSGTHTDMIIQDNDATTNQARLDLLGGSSGAGVIAFNDNAASIGEIRYQHSDNSMRLTTNGSVRVFIDSSGNVGIGTSSPGAKLHVDGEAIFRIENRINDTVPAGDIGRMWLRTDLSS